MLHLPADGVLYTAATSNFLGTLFDISRATGNEGERIRTEQSINWLNGELGSGPGLGDGYCPGIMGNHPILFGAPVMVWLFCEK